MRVEYTLVEIQMVEDEPDGSARPAWRAALNLPEDSWDVASWVRKNAADVPVLSVLYAEVPEEVPTGHREGE